MIQFTLKEHLARRQRQTGERLTYRALAERAHLTAAQISEIANNKMLYISLSTIDRLCQALGVQPGEILIRVPDQAATDE
jgi:DNA-binding Xre family transcriptional regulator